MRTILLLYFVLTAHVTLSSWPWGLKGLSRLPPVHAFACFIGHLVQHCRSKSDFASSLKVLCCALRDGRQQIYTVLHRDSTSRTCVNWDAGITNSSTGGAVRYTRHNREYLYRSAARHVRYNQNQRNTAFFASF